MGGGRERTNKSEGILQTQEGQSSYDKTGGSVVKTRKKNEYTTWNSKTRGICRKSGTGGHAPKKRN